MKIIGLLLTLIVITRFFVRFRIIFYIVDDTFFLFFFLVREDVCEWKNLFWFEEASEVSKGVRNNS